MRAFFGLLGLLIALAIAALVIKKQLDSTRHAIPVLEVPASAAVSSDKPDGKPGVAGQLQTQQILQHYQQAVEGALQQARPLPDDK